MKAMAMVAHPDDCVIFAYSYIHNHPEYSWTVCYLTYNPDDARSKEFVDFWSKRGIATKFLGFKDNWNDTENRPGDINDELARLAIQQALADQDLVLTHNSQGDYGHPHHVLVHNCSQHHPNVITFAGPGTGTLKYNIEPGVYDLSELPLHRDIISGFHKQTHCNEYNTCKNI